MHKIFSYFLELLLPRTKLNKQIESLKIEDLKKFGCKRNANLPPQTFALFDYSNPLIKQMIWELKYRGNQKIAKLFAECVYENLAEELSERQSFEAFEMPLLIPIPLSKKRYEYRGFNQCELITNSLHKLDGGNFFMNGENILIKIKDTESQTKKNRGERLLNLHGCFAVNSPEKIKNKNVILLDDVTTTGATFDEARKTLKTAGARKIIAVALAH